MPAAITAEEIRLRILEAIPDAQVQVQDYTGGGDHYEALVVSSAFAGKLPIARHRLVYGALQDAMEQRIHALALTTMTPEEFQKSQAQSDDLVTIQPRNSRS